MTELKRAALATSVTHGPARCMAGNAMPSTIADKKSADVSNKHLKKHRTHARHNARRVHVASTLNRLLEVSRCDVLLNLS